MALSLELLDQPSARGRQTNASTRIAFRLGQGSQPTLFKAPLVSSGGAHRIAKGTGHIVLIGPTLIDEAHHRVRFGHPVAQRILGPGHPRNEHQAMSILGADLATFIDELEGGGVVNVWEEIILPNGVHTAIR